MTSKAADMRDKVKEKFSKKKADVPENEEAEAPIINEPEEILYEEPAVQEEPDYPVYKEKKPIRWWKVFLSLFLLIIFGGGAGVFYYISNIDWNEHKDKIAAQFSELTGKRIEFDGEVHFSILPSPYLLAEDIKIYNPGEHGEEPLARIKSLVANLSLVPLLQGNFDVKMMELKEPDIRFEVQEDGSLNWESSFTDAQRQKLEEVKVALDSVMIEKAKFNFIDPARDIHLHLDKLNAEIIAQSIFGPYRIEGSYLKDNNPEGFAFSIGKLSSGFATTIDMVVNQPTTETFVRFDGSVMPQNKAINGNLILESKKLMSFINSNFNDFQLDKAYDYPLSLRLEVKSNKTKLDFTNFVMKYGETAGAGNLLIPLNDAETAGGFNTTESKRPKIELGFNFTDLDLTPAVALVKQLADKYNTGQADYNPELSFDLLGDIKAIKTKYNGQMIKNFRFSFDFVDNNLNIRDLGGVVPGDTSVDLKGNIYSDLGHLTYNFETSLKSDEFLQTLKWLDINPALNSDAVLKRISWNGHTAGNFQKISVSPFDLSVDKTTIKGEAGFITGDRLNMYLNAKADMINFDSYVKPLPAAEASKSFAEKMAYRFSKLGLLNDFDAELDLSLDLGIYENSPFENAKLQGSLKRGALTLKNMDMPAVANAAVNAKGVLKGFGTAPEFTNLKFEVATKDMAAFLNKTDIKAPDINFKNLKNFSAKGIATGNLDKFATKSIFKLENINVTYGGRVEKIENSYAFSGDLDVKSPDFVKMLNDFKIAYNPKAFALGLFNLKTKFAGTPENFKADKLEFNIGPNTFTGSLVYDASGVRKAVTADLDINKLELEKFFYNDTQIKSDNKLTFRPQPGGGNADFLSRPVWDKTRINYEFYKSFDMKGNFKIDRITFSDTQLDYAEFGLDLKDGNAKLNHFKANYHGGVAEADLELNMASDKPSLHGNVNFTQYKTADSWSGDKYGFKNGSADIKAEFDTAADSFGDMYEMLNAKIDLSLYNVTVTGWDIPAIYADITKRESSDGLTMMVKNNLMNGETVFQSIKALIDVKHGQYTVNNAVWSFGEGTITSNDQGNLNSWELNADFHVKYREPEYLPGFGFSFTGSLSSPALEPDTEALAIMYNNRKAEMDAQEEAIRQAEQERLNKMMKDQELLTNGIESEVRNVVRAELASRMEQAKSPQVTENYKKIEESIKKIEGDIAELYLTAKTPNYDDALIQNMSVKNKEISVAVKTVKEELSRNNIDNLKYIINENYNQIISENNQAKEVAAKYRTEYADLMKRLGQVKTDYSLADDSNVRRLRNKIEGNLLALDNIASSVQTDYTKLQGARNAVNLEKYATDISVMLTDAKKYVPSIIEATDELLSYAGQRIGQEEEAYRKKIEEEEIKRKLEENTGKISVKGTGVSKTVVRDIDEIQKSEEALENKKVEVLDFSDEVPVVNQVYSAENPKEKSGGEVKSEGGILKKPDGSLVSRPQGKISKASGVIIRK